MGVFIDGVRTMNPYELNGRYRKVTAFIDYLWGTMSEESRRDPIGPWTVSEADEAWWEDAAARAGVNVPSAKSRVEIVVALCKRVNSERRGATEPCNGCSGSCVENVRLYGRDGDSYMDGERDCSSCEKHPGFESCEDCRSAAATLSVPTGFFCRACSAKTWPEIAGAAAPQQSQGASQMRKVAGNR